MSIKHILPRVTPFLRCTSLKNPVLNSLFVQQRNSSYQNSKTVENIQEFNSKFEVTKSPDDWKYVERILAPLTVPIPIEKADYASGWQPQNESVENEKYFVQRNKNFMIPVYLETSHRGMRKITKIRRIQGNVFELEKDLKQYLETTLNKKVATQTNELVGYIHLKGDYVTLTKEYLLGKGF